MKVLFGLIAIIFLGLGAHAQFVPSPFDVSKKLPSNFDGHDVRKLLPTLLSAALEVGKGCGKYEKSEDCQARMNSIYDRKFSPVLTMRDVLAISVVPECTYSADSEVMICGVGSLASFRGIKWESTLVKSGQYMGTNAFGVKKPVLFRETHTTSVETDRSVSDFRIEKYSPKDAEAAEPHLRLLIIGTPLQPFAKFKESRSEPTIADPYETVVKNTTIRLELAQVWFYDRRTGNVLGSKLIK